MWTCHKCGKPVYFAERKQSLGYDWHPECLRCEECGKRLNPGQHAEHKGVPYCHVPCYGALFGPQLFGHGTRVESHKNFGAKGAQRVGNNGPVLPRDHLESKLKVYNQFYDNKSCEIRSREVNNRLILEGALRVYWGVQGVIHLKEDDDQRTLIVRKRNSARVSRGAGDESNSDKENDVSETFEPASTSATTGDVDPLSTDVSLSESMTFDSCSLNEDPVSDLPTTPEDVSANTTGTATDKEILLPNCDISTEDSGETTESSNTLCDRNKLALSGSAATLPSKLENVDKSNWDEIDELLRVERVVNEKDKVYETMPAKLPSSSSSSTQTSSSSSSTSSPSKTTSTQNITDITNLTSDITTPSTPTAVNSSSSSSTTTSSSDNYLTATTSLTSTTNNQGSTAATTETSVDNYETSDNATLKPMDFEEFQRSVHQEYVNGANSFQEPNDDTLKKNQPIDPSRIHDSLKLYGENPMSKSFCELALRSIDPTFIKDTLTLKSSSESNNSPRTRQQVYSLQKSGSTTTNNKNILQLQEKGINRSKSGPSCFDYSDSDDDSTLKPERQSTMRRSDIPPRFIQIKMNCYPKKDDGESSQTEGPSLVTNSASVAGDELTQTDEMFTANSNGNFIGSKSDSHQPQALHVTEDGVVLRRPPRTGAAAIKRRSGNRRSRTKLKRRCSINGHFYNRETSIFTPPYGSQMSVWVTSLVTTQEVINLVLEKYKVDMCAENFSLFIIRDNGEQKRLKDNDYPLITRVMLGPHEDVARLFLVDAKRTDEISNEVAQFINLSYPECRAILERYNQELDREVAKVKEKYAELRRRIVGRMESLKVHL